MSQIKTINELFLLLFLGLFFFNWLILNTPVMTTIILSSQLVINVIFFFAVPKKRTKKSKNLKTKIFNKHLYLRQLNLKSVHFDEFFNNFPKWQPHY